MVGRSNLLKLWLLVLLWAAAQPAAGEEDPLQLAYGPRNDSIDEGESLEEEWIQDAILDLAYYLRSHKFNEYDRRYMREETGKVEYFGGFPKPGLRSLHWEASRYCSLGLSDCLTYSLEFVQQARINRAIDTVYVMSAKNWTFAQNKKEIEKADAACQKFFKEDWEKAEPFPGPIHRFQWRTTMSYYMCMFTMQKLPSLSTFGEDCDNYANCLWDKNKRQTGDPRADDSQPFACAKYSFCPDPCCPLRTVSSLEECVQASPCPPPAAAAGESGSRSGPGGECRLLERSNTDLLGLADNRWNLSCPCTEPGFIWDSRFGLCVDIDECGTGEHKCHNESEICLNVPGTHRCVCAFGYRWLDGACQPFEPLLHELQKMETAFKGNLSLNETEFAAAGSGKTLYIHNQYFQLVVLVSILVLYY